MTPPAFAFVHRNNVIQQLQPSAFDPASRPPLARSVAGKFPALRYQPALRIILLFQLVIE
jgi:hypothetical protein